jgi:hypothetical protein
MKSPRAYWLRLLAIPTLIAVTVMKGKAHWSVLLVLIFLLVTCEITYFRVRAMYTFFFKHALTGRPTGQAPKG